jgi:peptidoglycan-associated lipoprotein
MKRHLFVLVLSALMVSACSTTTKPAEGQDSSRGAAAKSAQVNSMPESGSASADELAEQLRNMAGKSIYFDFDKSAVKPEFSGLIKQQAEFMKAHDKVILTLEGNADERGSAEYNLALGSRRANAVRKSLVAAGVAGSQIKVVSMGENKPRLSCHDESCWKENRRVDFNGKLGS